MRAAALALLSGALYWSAFLAAGAWPLAFVASAPLLVALHRRGSRVGLALGGLQGLMAIVAAPWLFSTVRSFLGVGTLTAAMATAALLGYQALRPAIVFAAVARLEQRGWPTLVSFPLAQAAAERFFPAVLPWYAAAQVTGVPSLMQGASGVGAVGVGAIVAAVNALAATAWTQGRAGRAWKREAAATVALPLGLALAGAAAMRAVDAAIARAPAAHVALVQPAGPHDGKARRAALASAVALTESVGAGADLVVWPETVVPDVLDEGDLARWWSRAVVGEARDFGAPVVAGALVRHADGAVTNSAVLFERSHEVGGRYDKRRPLPFGERVPFVDTWPSLRRLFPRAGDVAAGREAAAMRIGGHALTPLVCVEDLVPEVSAEALRANPSELLVTLTDDAWFGRSSAWQTHLATARYRAIEHRRYLVRAANQAGTAIIDPAGRVVQSAAPYEPAVVEGEVRWLSETTLAERLGDGPWVAAAATVLVLAFARRSRSSSSLIRPLAAVAPHGAAVTEQVP